MAAMPYGIREPQACRVRPLRGELKSKGKGPYFNNCIFFVNTNDL